MNTNGYAETVKTAPPKCPEVLSACDLALRAGRATIDEQLKHGLEQDVVIEAQRKELALAKDTPWYENKYVWGVVGLIVGGYMVSQVRK